MKRIVLDTAIVRQQCYEIPSWHADFVRMKNDGWSFHISDVAFAEIVAARERGSISEQQWELGVMRVSEFLADSFPVIPSKKQFFRFCGLRDKDDDSDDFDSDFEEVLSKSYWEALAQPWPRGGGANPTSFEWKGKIYEGTIKTGEALKATSTERENWIALFDGEADPEFDYDKDVRENLVDFDSWALSDGPPMSVRGNILAHAMAERRRRKADGYDPKSRGSLNDGMDHFLLYSFLWPALLCTDDGGLLRLVTGLKSFQSSWIYRPEDLASAFVTGELVAPSWPA